jgi:hypothetical protein
MDVTVTRAWQQVLDTLPPRTVHALFVAAEARSPGMPPPGTVLAALDLGLADLTPAERLGLVQVTEDRIELRHPLLRQVLVNSMPIAARLSTYRALATVAPPEQRPWYLSIATVGPDEHVARSLDTAAVEARGRAAHATAAGLAHRAAELSDADGARAQRLLAAAGDALAAGQAARAERWAAGALDLRHDAEFVATATLLRCRCLTWMGDTSEAAAVLLHTGEALRAEHAGLAARLFYDAAMPLGMDGDLGTSLGAVTVAESLLPPDEAPLEARLDTAASHLLCGAVDAGRERLRLARLLLPRADPVNALILAHLGEGNRIEAHRSLDAYARLLRRELGVDPPAELAQLCLRGGVLAR